jgi:hypothetical protein
VWRFLFVAGEFFRKSFQRLVFDFAMMRLDGTYILD